MVVFSVLVLLFAGISVGARVYVQHPKFGMPPEGDRLAIVEKSPNYANGEFRNRIVTPMFAEGNSFAPVVVSSLLSRQERLKPSAPLPSVKTDFRTMDTGQDTVLWLGHASYFVQLGGKRILIDPVFSPVAAPVPYSTRAFNGTNLYTADDMPEIDYLLITHDHWDHLDYATVTALAPKVKKVVTGLGVGSNNLG